MSEPTEPIIEGEPFPLDGEPVGVGPKEPKVEMEKEIELTEEEQRQIYNALSFYLERSDGLEKKDEKVIKGLLANKFKDLDK